MAGDGGRVPDVSEQRAEPLHGPHCTIGPGGVCMSAHCQWCGRPHSMWTACGCEWSKRKRVAPASVLAALLAESPDATVSAIEALLTSDEAMERAVVGMQVATQHEFTEGYYRSLAAVGLKGACRSLLSKAPKEDDDA